MGAIALLGVVFALDGCAEKDERLRIHKEDCQNRNNLYYAFGRVLHNHCLDVAGGYREQHDSISIGFNARNEERYLDLNLPYKNEKPNKELSEKYLQMGIEQLREELSRLQIGSKAAEGCRMIKDGAALNTLRDELHKVQLKCITDSNAILNNKPEELLLDTPDVRAKLYQYADFTPKQIEDVLRKDYPLRAEIVSKACRAYSNDSYYDNIILPSKQMVETAEILFDRFCNEAQDLYMEGGSYNGVQVFAPNPNHPNAKFAQTILNKAQKQVAKMEDEEGLQTDREIEEFERSLDMQEAEDQQYQKSVAKDCKTKYKNAKLCEIATQEMLRFRLEKRGLEQTSEVMFQDIKTQVKSYDIKTLRVIMQEIKNKPKHKYKDVSYCRSVVPYVWNALNWHDEVNLPMKDYVAGICGKN